MQDADFVNYSGEWWHFCYGDKMWAAYKHRRYAIYGEIEVPKSGTKVSKTATFDTHGYLSVMQAADLAVVCGDIFPGEMDKDPKAQGEWFRQAFHPWAQQIQSERVILIAGIHDHWIASHSDQSEC